MNGKNIDNSKNLNLEEIKINQDDDFKKDIFSKIKNIANKQKYIIENVKSDKEEFFDLNLKNDIENVNYEKKVFEKEDEWKDVKSKNIFKTDEEKYKLRIKKFDYLDE